MATFQDTGKCKGFAFIDFKNEEGATNALNSKLTKIFINRKLRMEYGEDRSAKRPKRLNENRNNNYNNNNYDGNNDNNNLSNNNGDYGNQGYEQREYTQREPKQYDNYDNSDSSRKRQYRERETSGSSGPQQSNKRMKSSVALASAQRASAAIVPSAGKKIKFD